MQYLLDRRGGTNRYKIKTDFFKRWSNEMAYVLGFLYADGDIVDAAKSSRTQYIKITNKDRDILLSIKNVLQSEHPIHYRLPQETIDKHGRVYKSSRIFYLRIGNRRMFTDLKKLGLVPNKSKVIKFPDIIPNKYLSHFIRGYFDGDGSIILRGKYGVKVAFTSGSLYFLKSLSKILSKELQIKSQKVYNGHRSYQLCYRTNESLKILHFIYRNKLNGLFLHRKHKIFTSLIKSRNRRYNINLG